MCMDSTTRPRAPTRRTHQELSWIQNNVFTPQCTFSGCHNGENTKQGKIDLRRRPQLHATLVNGASALDVPEPSSSSPATPPRATSRSCSGRSPGPIDPTVGRHAPDNGGQLLCCQKLDAIERWITDGAMNN